MGVRGLESFFEKFACYHQAFYDIDIKKIVEDHKDKTNLSPVIIISASSANRFLYQNEVKSWIHGGQPKLYAQLFINLISQLQNIGAEVVVVFQGVYFPSPSRNVSEIRDIDSINLFVDVFENIKYGTDPNKEESRSHLRPNNLNSAAYYAAKTMGCKVICSTNKKIDAFLAFYARKHHCIGILTQDSALVVHESPSYYLSMKHLDINKMITKTYDRKKLIQGLKILPSHLPLLASLVGNSIINREYLQGFHWRLKQMSCNRIKLKSYYSQGNRNYYYYQQSLFNAVTNFIRSLPYLSGPDLEEENIRKLASEVFIADVDKCNLFVESVLSYQKEAQENENLELFPITADGNWNEILRKLHQLVSDKLISCDNAYIMLTQTFSMKLHVEDYLNIFDCSSFEVIKPLLEKLFGILLFEKPGESEVVVHVKTVPPNYIYDSKLKPVFPSVKHPGLLALWSGDVEKKWSMIRDLFAESDDRVRSLPSHLVIPSLTFKFLKKKLKIQNHEMDALISSACLLSECDAEFLKTIVRPVATVRSLALYGIVTTTFRVVIKIFDAIGNPIPTIEITPVNYQDGLVFNLKYYQACHGCEINELCDEKDIVIDRFHQLKSFILH